MVKEKIKIGEWKALMVSELSDGLKGSGNFYISDYLGLKADKANELRRLLEPVAKKYMVVKNSIVRKALETAGLKELSNMITGGTGLIFSDEDVVATAKVLAKFGKDNKSLKVRGGYIDGNIIDGQRVKELAALPSKEELIARVVYGIKAPITGFVGVLSNTLRGLVFCLEALKQKKGGQNE